MEPVVFNKLLITLFGTERAEQLGSQIINLASRYHEIIPRPGATGLSEKDSILITYGDQVKEADSPHLKTLTGFCKKYLEGNVSALHILPFFPWSSDDGFSVKDFRIVDPALGNWQDIENLGRSFRLMVDGVINHASVQGEWFKAFLRDEKPYRDYFLVVEGDPDLSKVVRPRALPLLTEFQAESGPRKVWTTFSADQADLNYQNPDVLLEIIDILLSYAEHGAQFIRLDAIAYLWKKIGTSCINLPQTHAVIQLLRAVFDEAAPHVKLITETNIPHEDNLSYFGDGKNEAQLIYNFSLPPLIMHTFLTGNCRALSEWAENLEYPSGEATFINFLASHDGIGLNPVRGILSQKEIDFLIDQTIKHGGLISYKDNPDGTSSAYEMNINFFDALSDPACNEPDLLQIDRFMAAHAIMLSLRGIPGIYFHSLFGSRSWRDGVGLTHQNRQINRQKFERAELEKELNDPHSLRSHVVMRFNELLRQRAASSAFHPQGSQEILDMGSHIFALLRRSLDGTSSFLCLHNITSQTRSNGKYTLQPYQTLWIEN